jgi:hypothetical protein
VCTERVARMQDTRATVLCNAAEGEMISSSSASTDSDTAAASPSDLIRANERLAEALQLRESLGIVEHPKVGWVLALLGEIHRVEGEAVTSEGLFR